MENCILKFIFSFQKFSTTPTVFKEQTTLFEQAREFSKQTELARKPEHHLSDSESEDEREHKDYEKVIVLI
jgi:hypothetical protein